MGVINLIITTIIASVAVVFTLKADNWGARVVIPVIFGLLGAVLNVASKQIIVSMWGIGSGIGGGLNVFFIIIPIIVAFIVGIVAIYLSQNK